MDQSNMKRPSLLKRKFIILPKFQLQLILWNAAIQVATFWIVVFANEVLVSKMKGMGLKAGFPPDHPYYSFVSDLSSNLFAYLAAGLTLSLVFTTLFAVFISHRIAGPIHRVYTHFRGVASNGKYTPIAFRKGDYIEDLAPIINEAFSITSKKE